MLLQHGEPTLEQPLNRPPEIAWPVLGPQRWHFNADVIFHWLPAPQLPYPLPPWARVEVPPMITPLVCGL